MVALIEDKLRENRFWWFGDVYDSIVDRPMR